MATGPRPAALQEERVRFAWIARLFGRVLARYIRLVAATARHVGPPVTQEQALFAIWHESNLAAAIAAWKLRADKRVISFSTRGFRGVVMNAMLEAVEAGVVTLPEEGRQSRAEAARMTSELARLGREGWSLVVSCDGPFGPYRVAKPGALIVAREAGIPIQPWAVSAAAHVPPHGPLGPDADSAAVRTDPGPRGHRPAPGVTRAGEATPRRAPGRAAPDRRPGRPPDGVSVSSTGYHGGFDRYRIARRAPRP